VFFNQVSRHKGEVHRWRLFVQIPNRFTHLLILVKQGGIALHEIFFDRLYAGGLAYFFKFFQFFDLVEEVLLLPPLDLVLVFVFAEVVPHLS